MEAHIFRLRLEAEGIFAVVAHEHHVWANWPYAMALGGVKVQVPPSELEERWWWSGVAAPATTEPS